MFRKFCFLILLTGVCSQEEQNENRNSTGELILQKKNLLRPVALNVNNVLFDYWMIYFSL